MTAGLIKGGEVNIKKSRNRLTEMEDNISNQYRSQNQDPLNLRDTFNANATHQRNKSSNMVGQSL